jgi:DNA polymerase I-like protein with 3'-5' exonuclease and polymerase domains
VPQEQVREQNIPLRTEDGRLARQWVRHRLVAHSFVADFNNIEKRLLALCDQDKENGDGQPG